MKLAALAPAFAVTLVPVFAPFVLGPPSASADPLPNGYDVSCTPNGDSSMVCITSGCPRVHEDEAGDVIHTLLNGSSQTELSKACGNTTTETLPMPKTVSFTYSVQGCRKHFPGTDDCGAWADYHWTAQAAPVPVQPPKPVDIPAPVEQPKPAEVPAPPVVVTDAITATVTPRIGKVDVHVENSSDLKGSCTYDSSPFGKHQAFAVGAHGSTDFSIGGLNSGTTYHVVINCTDASGKQGQPIGHVEQDVTF